ncbi:MAG: ABC transporter ATP-binding protein, partial [Planctomycetota bacterium]
MAQVSLEAVTRNFGRIFALRGVSLSVGEGEVATILGPSGCGKTTLLRIIAGLELPTQGGVRIGGKMVTDGRRFVQPRERGIGMVFQEPGLWPHVNVEKTVMLSAGTNGMEPDSLQILLDSIGLGVKRKRYPHELSGGERQRLALARALAGNPRVLLLDEPLANLDAPLREEVLAVLGEIHRSSPQMTIIAASHQQQEAIEFSDRLIVMSGGEVEQSGT